MKIIFLDIDGVINSMDFLHTWHGLKKAKGEAIKRPDQFGDPFDPRCIMNLESIIRKTDAKIVISSTWRMSGLNVMREMWKERKLFGEIIDITPRSGNGFRGDEIDEWLKKNPTEDFVILDDDSDFTNIQLNNFVKTDSIFGLSYGDVEKAVQILNGTHA